MKRTTNLIFLLCVLSVLLCVSALAADETVTAAGFYDIGTAQGVTVTPAASTGEVNKVTADVDYDDTYETFYANSDKLTVELSGAADGEYLVLLVTGSELPTAENTICYINQTQPSGGTVSFDVYPNLEDVSDAMTLYITSNAQDFEMKQVSLNYAQEKEYDLQPYKLGDVDGNGEVDVGDATRLLQHLAKIDGKTLTGTQLLAADTDKSGEVDVGDATRLLQHLAKIPGKEIVQ